MERYINCNFYFGDSATNRKKLFEEALLSAKHGKVLYILREELNELPELSQDFTSVSRHYMKMISFLYARTLESLIESISTMPNWQNVPSTIILDDMSEYCSRNHIQNACGVVSMLTDAAKSCSMYLKAPCRLHIAVTRDVTGDEYCQTLNDLYARNSVINEILA